MKNRKPLKIIVIDNLKGHLRRESMQLNVTTDYAIRIVLYLAIKKEITTSKEIGAAMGIPKNYVLKITHKLVEAGIIERLVGAQGGFSLAQKIDDITLLDILNIMEPTMRVNRCLEEDKFCSRYATENCPVRGFYCKMQEELVRVNAWGKTDTTDYYRNRLLVNMERARWQYALDKGQKYVIANVAAFMLQAINEETDSILEMRICVGSVKNKTPLLSSRIYYMELNPYWNVPQSIIRKEIIPTYRRDTTYFTRNRMKVYDKNGLQVNHHQVNWAKYAGKGVPYTVKQDNKTGNSLGRIIFRFPNPHSVYLHDTPSRWAFTRNNRAVSHGCVRLQKALDFAFFLLKEPDELLEDRIRIAMDIKPVSEEGKKLPVSAAYRELKHYSLEKYIPLFIDYQTVYLSADNNLRYCEDIYKYDPSLLEAMNNLNLKP